MQVNGTPLAEEANTVPVVAGPVGGAVRAPNRRLARLMAEAQLSRKAMARAVRRVSAELGTPVATDHVAVGRWLNGTTPRRDTAHAITVVLGRALGRAVTLADIGLEPTTAPVRPDEAIVAAPQNWPAEIHELRHRLDWLAEEIASLSRTLAMVGGQVTR